MGNIEPWMNNNFISRLLGEQKIFPSKITLKNTTNKKGCAFLEFNTQKEAEKVIKNFNGKTIEDVELKFNWVRSLQEKYALSKKVKFTVRKNILI